MQERTRKILKTGLITIAAIAGIVVLGTVAYAVNNATQTVKYDYDHFNARQYNFKRFDGPKVGEAAVDFTATDLNGKTVRLSDYFGKTVVLETGSITCPMFVDRMQGMRELVAEFPDVVFLIQYVREAHPGSGFPQPKTNAQKLEHARQVVAQDGETRTILVDDVSGAGHKAYGSWPNSAYVIDGTGVVAYRQQWVNPPVMREALKRLAANQSVADLEAKVIKAGPEVMSRVLWRAGPEAVMDFTVNGPTVVVRHALEDKKMAKELHDEAADKEKKI